MENITKFYIRHGTLFGKISNTELNGRNELGLFMKITKISDILNEQMSWKERLTGGGGEGGRVDRPCSSFTLAINSDLARKGNRSL